MVVSQTWGSQVAIQWYSEGKRFPKELGNVVEVRDETYLAAVARGEGYKFMMYKMQWVWDHVLKHAPPSDWYIRHW